MTALLPPATHDEVDDAIGILERHAHHPCAFLALNRETRHFGVPGLDGLIAYRPAGRRHLVQLGGPFASGDDYGRLLDAFLNHARAIRRRVVAVELLREDAAVYAGLGFDVNQMGASYAVDLQTFTLAGTRFVKLRNKVSRARRAGVTVSEIGVDRAAGDGVEAGLAAVDQEWLRAKGRHVKELTFMVGERAGPPEAAAGRRVFVAFRDGEVLAYIQYCPVFGRTGGWLHDLTRRRPDVPPGVLELLNVTAAERFRAEGARYLHLGLTPFTGLDEAHELEPGRSAKAAWFVRFLAEHGEAVYPARSQLAYKMKWGPTVIEPEYVAFQGGVRLGAVWRLLRLTQAV